MAVYFLRSKHVSRGKESRVTRAAVYRSGERIRDERTSEVYDYSDRCDVAHREIVLPADLAEHPHMDWARGRATLWNAAEHAGLRCNSRLAREWLAILPGELTPERRIQLARGFATELAEKYRCAVDVCAFASSRGGCSESSCSFINDSSRGNARWDGAAYGPGVGRSGTTPDGAGGLRHDYDLER